MHQFARQAVSNIAHAESFGRDPEPVDLYHVICYAKGGKVTEAQRNAANAVARHGWPERAAQAIYDAAFADEESSFRDKINAVTVLGLAAEQHKVVAVWYRGQMHPMLGVTYRAKLRGEPKWLELDKAIGRGLRRAQKTGDLETPTETMGRKTMRRYTATKREFPSDRRTGQLRKDVERLVDQAVADGCSVYQTHRAAQLAEQFHRTQEAHGEQTTTVDTFVRSSLAAEEAECQQ